jgi:hypothetical protein
VTSTSSVVVSVRTSARAPACALSLLTQWRLPDRSYISRPCRPTTPQGTRDGRGQWIAPADQRRPNPRAKEDGVPKLPMITRCHRPRNRTWRPSGRRGRRPVRRGADRRRRHHRRHRRHRRPRRRRRRRRRRRPARLGRGARGDAVVDLPVRTRSHPPHQRPVPRPRHVPVAARPAPHPGHRPGRCTADPRVGHRHHLRRLGALHDPSRRALPIAVWEFSLGVYP